MTPHLWQWNQIRLTYVCAVCGEETRSRITSEPLCSGRRQEKQLTFERSQP